jgi:hypothetical protein
MAKKRVPKRRVWNKGLKVGKRDGFTPDQVKRIRGLLASQQRAPVLQGTESRLTSEHAQDLEQVLGIVCGALAAPLDRSFVCGLAHQIEREVAYHRHILGAVTRPRRRDPPAGVTGPH